MGASATERQASGVKGTVQRHPIAAFLLLALGSVYVLAIIPILMHYDVIPGRRFRPGSGLIWRGSAPLC